MALLAAAKGVADVFQECFGLGRRRRRGGRFGLLAPQIVDQFDHQKNHQGDDGELDQGVEKRAVLDGHLGLFGGRVGGLQHDLQLSEVDTAGGEADGRHNDLVDKTRDDLAEGAADDYADRQVNDIASGDELLEFAGERRVVSSRAGWIELFRELRFRQYWEHRDGNPLLPSSQMKAGHLERAQAAGPHAVAWRMERNIDVAETRDCTARSAQPPGR